MNKRTGELFDDSYITTISEETGLTFKDLSKLLNVSEPTIGRWRTQEGQKKIDRNSHFLLDILTHLDGCLYQIPKKKISSIDFSFAILLAYYTNGNFQCGRNRHFPKFHEIKNYVENIFQQNCSIIENQMRSLEEKIDNINSLQEYGVILPISSISTNTDWRDFYRFSIPFEPYIKVENKIDVNVPIINHDIAESFDEQQFKQILFSTADTGLFSFLQLYRVYKIQEFIALKNICHND